MSRTLILTIASTGLEKFRTFIYFNFGVLLQETNMLFQKWNTEHQ